MSVRAGEHTDPVKREVSPWCVLSGGRNYIHTTQWVRALYLFELPFLSTEFSLHRLHHKGALRLGSCTEISLLYVTSLVFKSQELSWADGCVRDSSKAAGITTELLKFPHFIQSTLSQTYLEEDFSCSCWSVLLLSTTEKPLEQMLSLCLSPSCKRNIWEEVARTGPKSHFKLCSSSVQWVLIISHSHHKRDFKRGSSCPQRKTDLLFLETCSPNCWHRLLEPMWADGRYILWYKCLGIWQDFLAARATHVKDWGLFSFFWL